MKALIFKNPKNPMQSGKAKTNEWLLEPILEKDSRFIDSMMGWTGGTDMNQEMVITFKNQEEAMAYAEREGMEYEVIKPQERKVKIRTYADNFKFSKPVT